jgi:hypothetical protein
MATAFLNVFASTLTSYQQLTEAMKEVKNLVILLDLQQCTGKPGMSTGYFTPTSMMIIPEKESAQERVVTSHLHFTNQSGSPTYEYVKYTFNADNTVLVETTFYDPETFKLRGTTHIFNCLIRKGITVKTAS